MKGNGEAGVKEISGVSGWSHLENNGTIDIVKERGQGVAKELDIRVEMLSLTSLSAAEPGLALCPLSMVTITWFVGVVI